MPGTQCHRRMHQLTHPFRRPPPWVALAAMVVASLTAGGTAGAAPQNSTSGRRFGPGPGAFGSVAAISGTSMEVQNASTGQTTVDWTSSTTFTQNATVSVSSITAGDCVTVTGTSSKGTITAKTVAIRQAGSSSGCTPTGGPGSFRGTGGAGGGSFRPPSGSTGGNFPHRATAQAGGYRRAFPGAGDTGFASGKVTMVASTTLTLSGISSAAFGKETAKAAAQAKTTGSSGKSKNAKSDPTAPKATTVHVKLASSTTYTETQPAAASSLAVGDCVAATGTSSTNGSVSASTVAITSTGGQSCTVGFGFGGAAAGGSASG
ncbi:MAG: DUF5666 domain-containing protein [Acidimicrobiales bacterium]